MYVKFRNFHLNVLKIPKFSQKARHQKYDKFLCVRKIPKKNPIMYINWNLIPRTPYNRVVNPLRSTQQRTGISWRPASCRIWWTDGCDRRPARRFQSSGSVGPRSRPCFADSAAGAVQPRPGPDRCRRSSAAEPTGRRRSGGRVACGSDSAVPFFLWKLIQGQVSIELISFF